jgi:hypothetical protein
MSSQVILGCWRFLVDKPTLAILNALLRRRCGSAKYGRYSAGKCRFCGPPDFLALCGEATDKLSALDPHLYQSLLTRNLKFWYEPKGPAVFTGHFGISDGFVAWRHQGIIACVLYAHFEAHLIEGRSWWRVCMDDTRERRKRVDAAVRVWLEDHQFASELAEFFRYGA